MKTRRSSAAGVLEFTARKRETEGEGWRKIGGEGVKMQCEEMLRGGESKGEMGVRREGGDSRQRKRGRSIN